MLTSAILASLHYIALAVGFAGICLRWRALSAAKAGQPLAPIYLGDNMWGVAALLWIVTGFMRAFGGFEKGSAYYMTSTGFWIKMALFLAVFAHEIRPMLTFIKWRMAKKAEISVEDLPVLHRFARISRTQVVLILIIPIFASLMARGIL